MIHLDMTPHRSWREKVIIYYYNYHHQIGNDVSEWVLVNVGLRQDYVMFPWLFNVYMSGVVREVNVRVLWKGL